MDTISSSKMLFLWIFVLILNCIDGLPQGAPTKVCESMLPSHSGLKPQNSGSPYSITPRRTNGAITVTINSLLGTPFQGFMLQGRKPDGTILGRFETVGDFAHTIDCNLTDSTATHKNPNPKKELELRWLPSSNYQGPVIFTGTIAQDYGIFWVGVQSSALQIDRGLTGDDPTRFPSNRPFSSTPPNFTPNHREAAMEFDPFYSGCSSTKICFGSPDGCINTKNCKAAVAISASGEKYYFELKGTQNAKWVGVGLSQDDKMGDDSVIECAKTDSDLGAFLSWTSGNPNYGARRIKNQLGIRLLNQATVDDTIYCKVERDALTVIEGKRFDLRKDKYNLLIAAGSNTNGKNGVKYHDITSLASGTAISLADVVEVKSASKLLIHLHGAFMIAAWIGMVSIGTLLARYYRQTWVGSSMCGKDIWFAWHRLLMMTVLLLTVAGIVLIWIQLGAWSGEKNPHAILGTITTVLCFLQPIGAFFRPHPGTPNRPIFNWMHWLGGNIAHIVAIVTIFFAVRLSKAELPDMMDWILVGYVAFHVIVHLILSVMGCVSEKSGDGRMSAFPMRDLGTGRNAPYIDRSVDAPYGGARKTILGLYIIVIGLISIVLILFVVFAPIEDTWRAFRKRN